MSFVHGKKTCIQGTNFALVQQESHTIPYKDEGRLQRRTDMTFSIKNFSVRRPLVAMGTVSYKGMRLIKNTKNTMTKEKL